MARVEGFDPASSGQQPADANGNPVPVGVWGDSGTGGGVFGTSGTLPQGSTGIPIETPAGVEGHGLAGPGVVGRSIEDSGVVAESLQGAGALARSRDGYGLLGVTFSPTDDTHAIFGSSVTGGNGVTGFVGGATGVIGSSIRGTGVRGSSGTGHGVVGQNFGDRSTDGSANGVFGSSATGAGIRGQSTSRDGNQGVTLGEGYGVYGLHLSTGSGGGVQGQSILASGVEGSSFASGPNSAGVLGENPQGFAGLFLGKVRVTGHLAKAGGGFTVDHPLDPENKYLSHSFVESPDMLNVYSGTVVTDEDGAARVVLPEYCEALNRDFRYQLTVVGQFAQAIVSEEVEDGAFTIRTDIPRVKVCWQVTGVRQDAWAAANPIAVEEDKVDQERGHYLHPDLYGKGRDAGIHQGGGRESLPKRAAELVPEDLRERVGGRLQALVQDGPVDDEELRQMLAGLRGRAEASAAAARARLKEQWGKVQESLKESFPADLPAPAREAERPADG